MKTLLESAEFQGELSGWAVRGVLCALNSAFWAFMLGFQQPAEFAGMAVGVAFWVAVFAVLCAWTPRAGWWRQPRFGAALKRAALIKIGLTAAGWLCFAAASQVRTSGAEALTMLGMVDMLLGLAALWVVGLACGLSDPSQVAALDSFGWTALTTVVEGALMAALIGGIALGVLVWWRWGGQLLLQAKIKLSPVRVSD